MGLTLLFHLVSASISVILTNAQSFVTDIEFFCKNRSLYNPGHAVVMLQPNGQNSIIIVGGANMNGWNEKLSEEDLEVVRGAGMLLLQHEIPDWVNLQVAQVNFNFPCLIKPRALLRGCF
jgi:hypothetical protein